MITVIFTFVVTSIKSSCSSISVADVSRADIWHLYAWVLAWITIIIIIIIYNVYQSLCFQTESPFSLFVWSAPKMRFISPRALLQVHEWSPLFPIRPVIDLVVTAQLVSTVPSFLLSASKCRCASCVTKVWGFCVSCPFLGRFWDV